MDFGELPVFQVAGNIINIPVDIAKELQGKDSRIIQHAFDALGQLGHMLQYQRDGQIAVAFSILTLLLAVMQRAAKRHLWPGI